MEIDFDYEFKTLNGDIIPERPDEIVKRKDGEIKKTYPPFTLRMLCENVLLKPSLDMIFCPHCKAVIKRPKKLSGEKKVKRLKLAKKIHDADGPIDIEAGDIKLLKKLIAKSYPVSTAAQAWEALDSH